MSVSRPSLLTNAKMYILLTWHISVGIIFSTVYAYICENKNGVQSIMNMYPEIKLIQSASANTGKLVIILIFSYSHLIFTVNF